jgi:hypothetical protein
MAVSSQTLAAPTTVLGPVGPRESSTAKFVRQMSAMCRIVAEQRRDLVVAAWSA